MPVHEPVDELSRMPQRVLLGAGMFVVLRTGGVLRPVRPGGADRGEPRFRAAARTCAAATTDHA